VRVTKIAAANGKPAPAPTTTASAPIAADAGAMVSPTSGGIEAEAISSVEGD
jgi:hypothetical protein